VFEVAVVLTAVATLVSFKVTPTIVAELGSNTVPLNVARVSCAYSELAAKDARTATAMKIVIFAREPLHLERISDTAPVFLIHDAATRPLNFVFCAA
jgi:hypothetical protein